MEDSKRFSKMALFDSRKTLFYPWRAFIWLLEDNWREISFPRWLYLTLGRLSLPLGRQLKRNIFSKKTLFDSLKTLEEKYLFQDDSIWPPPPPPTIWCHRLLEKLIGQPNFSLNIEQKVEQTWKNGFCFLYFLTSCIVVENIFGTRSQILGTSKRKKAPKNGIFLKNVCLLSLLLLGQLKLGSIFPDLGLRTLPGFHFLSKFYLSWFFTSVNNRRCSRRREM